MSKVYLAVDLGAGSGRVIAGIYDGAKLSLEEVNRFENQPVSLRTGLYWNTLELFRNIMEGLKKAKARWGSDIVSVGVDTWGVDYGYFGEDGEMLGMPHTYRDPRTDGMQEYSETLMPGEEIYKRTGIQTVFLNTLYQVLSEAKAGKDVQKHAKRLLFMPDIINYFLTGRMVNERTISSTSQMYNPSTKDWDRELIEKMGVPDEIFGEIIDPGEEIGVTDIDGHSAKVIAVGAHDTASAVAAVPMKTENPAYQSSGTWSLFGFESDKPIITDESRAENFTNEIGVENTVRFLKNITGLWLVQECKRTWDDEGEGPIDYGQMTDLASEADPFVAFLDPDDSEFIAPDGMPQRICDYLKKGGQPVPADRGQITRIILESLAFKCRYFFERLESVSGKKFDTLHIVGGGCKNSILNQFMANALKVPVVTGPVEATSIGNILMQMKADGSVASLTAGREMVAESFPTQTYEPTSAERWDEAYGNFLKAVNL